jgi:hypothetical protein
MYNHEEVLLLLDNAGLNDEKQQVYHKAGTH